MEGRYPKGVLLLFRDCRDLLREAELSAWWDNVGLPRLMGAGAFPYATRYCNDDKEPGPGHARYLTILETDAGDLHAALDEFQGRLSSLKEGGRLPLALDLVLTGMFGATGPEFRASLKPRRTTGIMLLLSNCLDKDREGEFNEWYDKVHIPRILAGGRYHTAYRYESISPNPTQGRYLALYETDDEDPGRLAADLAKERPQWIDKGLYFPQIERVVRASYRRI